MFKELFTEDFDQTEYVSLALKWLSKKFPQDQYGYTFEHRPNLANTTKTFSVSQDGKCFDIRGRIFDANNSGEDDRGDIVQFRIDSVDKEPEDPEGF